MPKWFSWKNNVMLGVPALLITGAAIYTQAQTAEASAQLVMWLTAGGFVLLWVLVNYFGWRGAK